MSTTALRINRWISDSAHKDMKGGNIGEIRRCTSSSLSLGPLVSDRLGLNSEDVTIVDYVGLSGRLKAPEKILSRKGRDNPWRLRSPTRSKGLSAPSDPEALERNKSHAYSMTPWTWWKSGGSLT